MATNVQNNPWIPLVETYAADAAEQLGATHNERANEALKNQTYRSYNWHVPSFTYIDNSWNWGRKTTVIHNHTSASSREQTPQEKQEASAKIALVVGTIFLMIAAFTAGYFYSRNSGNSQTYQESTKALTDAKTFTKGHRELRSLVPFIEKRNTIDKDKYRESVVDLTAALTALAGSVSAVAGGLLISPVLITAGYVALIAAPAIFLANKAIHLNDGQKHNQLRAEMCKPGRREGSKSLADRAIDELTNYYNTLPPQEETKNQYVPVPESRVYPDLPPPLYTHADFPKASAPREGL